jgi:hypothetical protein
VQRANGGFAGGVLRELYPCSRITHIRSRIHHAVITLESGVNRAQIAYTVQATKALQREPHTLAARVFI